MPKRGPQRNAAGSPAQIPATASKITSLPLTAGHEQASHCESSWPAKCIVMVGTGRRVLEQEKQVTNWINSGGHVPRRYTDERSKPTAAQAPRQLENALAIGCALLALRAGFPPARPATDGQLRQFTAETMVRQPEKRQGACCSDADGSAVRMSIGRSARAGTTAFGSKASGIDVARGCRHHRAQPRRTHHGLADQGLSGIDDPLLHAR